MSSKKTNKYDIVVVGAGFTGLSAAYHLAEKKSYKIAIVSSPMVKSLSSNLCSISFSGSLDNFTRLSHQWGLSKAEKIWNFYHEAYRFSHAFVESKTGITSQRGQRIRLVGSEDEVTEIKKACQQLQSLHYKASYQAQNLSSFPFVGKKILAIQDEGESGGWIDSSDLVNFFQKALKGKVDFISAHIESVQTSADRVVLGFDEKDGVESEIALLCCHLGLGKIVPAIKNCLVCYQDESILLSYKEKKGREIPVGLTFSFFHGYIWGCFLPNNQVIIGGARFLRKDAGIAAKKNISNQKVKAYLLKTFEELFPCLEKREIINCFYGLEVNPCDEIPIVGPMFGEDRVLFATGFKGQGLTLGLYSGKCLADLIHHSKKSDLLGLFYPQRFRSL